MEGIEGRKSKRETASSSSRIGDDVLQNILSRLQARPFAAAACVNKSWNRVSNRILSRPKFASAISLNECPKLAMKEVVDKVLSQPIRPHFAIASVGQREKLKSTLKFMVENLGSNTPIVVSFAGGGIIGRDAVTDEFREVKWGEVVDDQVLGNSEISLSIGYLPGVKVDAIPLFNPKKEPQEEMIDKFVMDIRNFTASVSGTTSPIGIIMLGGGKFDQKPVIEKLDHAMPMETIIVGDESGPYLYNVGNYSRNVFVTRHVSKTVALVFAKDRNKDHGTGDILFHGAISEGVSAIGPKYKAASMRVTSSPKTTWLTARREGQNDGFGGQQLLDHINVELETHLPHVDRFDPELYIGVTKRRNYSTGSEKPRSLTSLAFHYISSADEEYLYADGDGIKSGDNFKFYVPDPQFAAVSCDNTSRFLSNLKSDWEAKSTTIGTSKTHNAKNKEEPFAGFIFSCCGRGRPFFNQTNVDSSPFLNNFPNIPMTGMFCSGEIARGNFCSMLSTSQENSAIRCPLHVYSTVYLLMTYIPASGEH